MDLLQLKNEEVDPSKVEFDHIVFEDNDLSGFDLRGTKFKECFLSGVNL